MKQVYSSKTDHSRIEYQEETPVISHDTLIHKLFVQDPVQGCEALFRQYYARLCNHAIRYVHSRDVAEEIVAEVFANFWQQRAYETITISYRAYLYKAVQNRAYNYIRFELNRTAPLELVNVFTEQSPSPDNLLHYHDLVQKIDSLIQQLPLQSRRAFLLHRIDGRKYEEIAAELSISVSAVERLISRALVKLRQGLKNGWLISIALIINAFLHMSGLGSAF